MGASLDAILADLKCPFVPLTCRTKHECQRTNRSFFLVGRNISAPEASVKSSPMYAAYFLLPHPYHLHVYRKTLADWKPSSDAWRDVNRCKRTSRRVFPTIYPVFGPMLSTRSSSRLPRPPPVDGRNSAGFSVSVSVGSQAQTGRTGGYCVLPLLYFIFILWRSSCDMGGETAQFAVFLP